MSNRKERLTGVSRCAIGARSAKFGVGYFAILVGLMMSTSAVSAEPAGGLIESAGPAQEVIADETDSSRFYLFLGLSLAVGLGAFALYRVRKFYLAHDYLYDDYDYHSDEFLRARLGEESVYGLPRPNIRHADPAASGLGGVFDDFLNNPDPAVARANLEGLARARAHFHAAQAQNMEDSTQKTFALGRKHRRALREQAIFAERYGLERLVCSGCDRRYSMAAQFCYHDGLPLMQDTTQLAQVSSSFEVCKACGWESDLGTEHPEGCPEAEASFTEIDARDSSSVLPMIPMMVCPTCGKFGAPGQTHCPVDAQVLSPLLDTRSPELPLRGFGPRRKVCTECGAAHGPSANYCSHDGAELAALN